MTSELSSEAELVAAIDLGSNSFHMIVGRLEQGQLHIIDRVRDRVRLGAGLDDRQRLTPEAQERAIACLMRFGERVRDMPPGRVRAVATNTLRQAKNREPFLERATEALGHPIQIIRGREEARLIYLGVLQTMPANVSQRLIVDIGGGSTECVIGHRSDLRQADSLFMGCVSYSTRFFPEGVYDFDAFDQAHIAAGLELASIRRPFRSEGWERAVGCSGTIHAVSRIARAQEWSGGEITLKVLRKLEKAMLQAGHQDRLQLAGLQEDRRPVMAGGVAILTAIFEHLGIERMEPSPGALREGALYDLVGRIKHEDVRDRTINWFCDRYKVDMEQVRRIGHTAVKLMNQVVFPWKLDVARAGRMLSWASHLHEIGLAISHTGYHKHSAYLVRFSDMAGFSRDEQVILAAVIRSHRRKIKRAHFDEVPKADLRFSLRLAVLFRLAVALHRNRSDDGPEVELFAKKKKLRVVFPHGWLDGHPLTRADFDAHMAAMDDVPFELKIRELSEEGLI